MGRSSGGERPIGRCFFLFMYIYFYMTLLMAGPCRFFLFFPTVLERCWVAEHIFDCFQKYYSWKKKPVVGMWIDDVYWCVLMISTDVY